MKVLIIGDALDNQQAGIHRYTKGMIHALLAHDPENEYIILRSKRDGQFPEAKQVIIPNTKRPLGWASFRVFVLVPLLARRLGVDAVLEPAHFGPFNLTRRTRRITVIHDLTPILFPKWHRWHSRKLQQIFLKGICRRADWILTNSKHTAADVCRVFPENASKVTTIYPGVPTPNMEYPSDALDQCGVRQPFLLFVGTLEPRKGLDTLLEAFTIVRNSRKGNLQLVIAGGQGWKTAGLRKQMAAHPFREDIMWTGHVSDEHLQALYAEAEVLIYPSRYEGFGLPIVEALHWGTPVIAANNSSLPEAGGTAATYFNTGDPTDLARVIDLIIDRRSESEASESRKQHAQTFSWEGFAKEFSRQLSALTVRSR